MRKSVPPHSARPDPPPPLPTCRRFCSSPSGHCTNLVAGPVGGGGRMSHRWRGRPGGTCWPAQLGRKSSSAHDPLNEQLPPIYRPPPTPPLETTHPHRTHGVVVPRASKGAPQTRDLARGLVDCHHVARGHLLALRMEGGQEEAEGGSGGGRIRWVGVIGGRCGVWGGSAVCTCAPLVGPAPPPGAAHAHPTHLQRLDHLDAEVVHRLHLARLHRQLALCGG